MSTGRRSILAVSLALLGAPVFAADISFEAKGEYRTNVDTKITEAEGGVKVFVDDQQIDAERMRLDGAASRLRTEGKVLYRRADITIEAEAAEFDLKSGLGRFEKAMLRMGTYFYMEGLELESIGPDIYRAKHGKMTSCKDCPQSWSVTGVDLEMRVEGYAEIHHALMQIKDVPVAYVPLLVFPVKTIRQSGFLIPQIGYYADLGNEYYLPYFWAINESSDTLLRYHYFTKGGNRLSAETRYRYSNRTWLDFRGSWLSNDGRLPELPDQRYSYIISQRAQILPGLTQRFVGELASDGAYTTTFETEFPSAGYPTLANNVSFDWNSPGFYAAMQFRFNKDNLTRNLAAAETSGLVPSGVVRGEAIHSLPSIEAAWPVLPLGGGPVLFSANVRTLSLTRRGSALDPVTDWIRVGQRGTLEARLEAPLQIGSFLNYQPSILARGDAYLFPTEITQRFPEATNAAQRARVVFEQNLSTVFDRLFPIEGADLKVLRHSWEPFVKWSYSPADALSAHPFFGQSGAPRFDLFDPSEESVTTAFSTTSAEQRLRKHHILTYGLGTRFVGRFGETDRRYEEFLGASIRQDIDLFVGRFGRFIFAGRAGYAGVSLSSEIAFEPTRLSDAEFRNVLSYTRPSYSANVGQTLIGDSLRQYSLGGSLNLLRPWYASGNVVFDARDGAAAAGNRRIVEWASLVGFDGGTSKCFYVGVTFKRPAGAVEMNVLPSFGIFINESSQNTLF